MIRISYADRPDELLDADDYASDNSTLTYTRKPVIGRDVSFSKSGKPKGFRPRVIAVTVLADPDAPGLVA